MNWSLRKRLVLSIIALMACGLIVADVAGVVLLRSYQLARLDEQLSFPFGRDQSPPIVPPQLCRQVASRPADGQLPSTLSLAITDSEGRVRCRLPGQPGPGGAPDLRGFASAGQLAAAARVPDPVTTPGSTNGAPWRVRVIALDGGYLILAASLAELNATMQQLTLVMVVVGVVILGLTAGGGLLLVRLGLRPLTRIEETAEAIAGGDLTQRVEGATTRTEVGRLSASLNTMLSQIERAFADRRASEERLSRFVADASHELRTPLSTIRGHAELYRHGAARSPEEIALLLSRIESESARMGKLVDDLLLLARLDAVPTLDRVPVDLLSVAADAVVDARAQAPTRAITLNHSLDPPWLDVPPIVLADEASLRQILGNLLGNAVRHTPETSPIEISLGASSADVELHVVDHGPGLPPEAAERAFERFYRADPGRSRGNAGAGAGLGLSIASSLVAANLGSVRHEPTPGGGATFIVSLPSPVQVRP